MTMDTSAQSSPPAVQTPQPPPAQPQTKAVGILGVAFVLALFSLVGYATIRFVGGRSTVSPAPTQTPTPTPTPRAIKQGKETYTISSSSRNGPEIIEATIDPHDPSIGDTQTMIVKARHTQPIVEIRVDLQSDNKTTRHLLTLTDGSSTNGVWQGSWTISDSVLYTYVATIGASDGQEKTSVDVTMR